MSDVQNRRATPEEISGYVTPTWLNSYALGFVGKLMRADARHGAGREAYWSAQRSKIERILSTSTTSVRVADYEGEPVAWIADDQTRRVIHYVFTNRAFRRQGLARGLLPAWYDDLTAPVYLSHLPPPWYSRNVEGAPKAPWPQHVCINLVEGY
jgi:hypothetical protein